MTALRKVELTSVEDYLDRESKAPAKHEYLGGLVVAMAGASRVHNRISGNLYIALDQRLRSGSCEVYMADVKLRIEAVSDTTFYYPDVLVTCSAQDSHRLYITEPKLVIEVLSPDTERIDRREKRLAYQQCASLEHYLIVAQDYPEVTVYSRSRQWTGQVLGELTHTLELPALQLTLPLAEIYRDVF